MSEPFGREMSRPLLARGWRCTVTSDFTRARWLASVQPIATIVVAGRDVARTTELIESLRAATRVPILMLAPRSDHAQSRLLRAGADMVIDHDSSAELLVTAVDALARRSSPVRHDVRYLRSRDLHVDLWARSATMRGRELRLTSTEFRLLRILMAHAQTVLSHRDVIDAVWSAKYDDDRNALRVQVMRLRRKLAGPGGVAADGIAVRCVRNAGYVFEAPVSEYADDSNAEIPDRRADSGLVAAQVARLTHRVLASHDRPSASAALVQAVIGEGLCASAAVFALRPRANLLGLVAHAGLPESWRDRVAAGISLTDASIAAETFTHRQTRCVSDVTRVAGLYSTTAALMGPTRLTAYLSLPLADRHGVWGQMGLGRESTDAFDTASAAVLETAAAVLGALHASPGRTVGPSADSTAHADLSRRSRLSRPWQHASGDDVQHPV